MYLQETILCATAASSSNSGTGSITVHDITNGSSLASFKQTNASRCCTSFVETKNSQGGFVLASQPDKPVLNVYNFQKDQVSSKIILPEKLSCSAVDPQGNFFAGGTLNGRIYLWEIASGILYNTWDAHYRQVTVLKFTRDGAALLSGSEDSAVGVWSVSRLLDEDLQNELAIPYTTLSDHTLPITDVVCGVGPFPNCRILTCSMDRSVKVWDMSSKSLLTTFQYPQPLSCLAWDVTERLFFTASNDGSIYQTNLFRQRDDKHNAQAIGGAGTSDILRGDDETSENRRMRLMSVGQPITCLSMSLTSSILLVGTSSGIVNIFDIPSHQLLRTINTHKGFAITCLATMFKPPDLIGHISLGLDVGSTSDAKDILPVRPVQPFQRVRDAKARENHEVSMILPVQATGYQDELACYSRDSILRDQSFFIQPLALSLSGQDPVTLQSKLTDLEAEVARLREQLGAAKDVNDAMWENVVQRVVRNSDGDNEGAGRSKKRLRETKF
ncbi:WD40-repeat-containing domain protein [Mycena floridula]|nr:WD40-repeat-containing domain protein [Mycena floridula]